MRFSLRAFLIVTTLLGAFFGPIAQRTLQQMRTCGSLRYGYELNDPPAWLTFLPKDWLDNAHWCRSVRSITIWADSSGTQSENHADLKNKLSRITKLPSLHSLELDLDRMSGSELEFTDTLAPLANIRKLQVLKIDSQNCDVVLQSLPLMPYLDSLTTGYDTAPLSKAAVDAAIKSPSLTRFETSCWSVEPGALSSLAKLPNIRVIHAKGLRTSAADLECFVGHPTLEELLVDRQYFTDNHLRIVASCPQMKSIHLESTLITDTGLAYVRELKHLEEITIDDTAISDAGFAHLANCKSLRLISAPGCKLTDAIGPTLSQLPNLQSIELSITRTTSKLLEHLTKHQNLEKLHLGGIPINFDDLKAFAHKRTEALPLGWGYTFPRSWHCAVSLFGDEADVKNHSETVWNIDLSSMSGIRDRLGNFQEPLAMVSSLDLSGSDIDDSDLRALSLMPSLRHLDLSNTKITAAGLLHLSQTPRLSSLRIGPIDNADDAMKIVSTQYSLEKLSFAGAEHLSNKGLSLFQNLQFLRELEFPSCEYDAALTSTIFKLPHVESVKWLNSSWGTQETQNQRLNAMRTIHGIPLGMQKWLATNPQLYEVAIVDEAELACLVRTDVRSLNCAGVPLSSKALKTISQLTSLYDLDLSNTGITDLDLASLTGYGLGSLCLNDNQITDAGISGIVSSGKYFSIEISNTQISEAGLSQIFQSNDLSRAALKNLPLSNLLKNLTTDDLPETIHLYREDFIVTRRSIKVLRNELPADHLTHLTICPSILDAWTLDDLFNNKDQLRELALYETQRTSQILNAAAQTCPNLVKLKIAKESLSPIDSIAFPSSLREIDFFNCTIDSTTLQAISKCPWLRRLRFFSCNLEGCSLEPLTNVPLLVEVSVDKTPLSSEQSQVYDRFQPPLVYSPDMFYPFGIYGQ